MPVPVYIICAESGATDDTTHLVSFFNLLEKLTMSRLTAASGAAPGVVAYSRANVIFVGSAWLREQGDASDTDFQVELFAMFPSAPAELTEIKMAEARFRFSEPLQRVVLQKFPIANFFGPGVLWIEARIRRVGDLAWINQQRYPIILEEGPPISLPPAQLPQQPVAPAN